MGGGGGLRCGAGGALSNGGLPPAKTLRQPRCQLQVQVPQKAGLGGWGGGGTWASRETGMSKGNWCCSSQGHGGRSSVRDTVRTAESQASCTAASQSTELVPGHLLTMWDPSSPSASHQGQADDANRRCMKIPRRIARQPGQTRASHRCAAGLTAAERVPPARCDERRRRAAGLSAANGGPPARWEERRGPPCSAQDPLGRDGFPPFPLHRSPGVLVAVQAQVALESVGPRGKEMIAQFLEPLSTGLFSEVS